MAHKGMRDTKVVAKTLADPEKASSVSLFMFICGSEGVYLLAVACCERYETLCTVEKFRTKCWRFEMGPPPCLLPYIFFFIFFFFSPVVSAGLLPRNRPTLGFVFFPQQQIFLNAFKT